MIMKVYANNWMRLDSVLESVDQATHELASRDDVLTNMMFLEAEIKRS